MNILFIALTIVIGLTSCVTYLQEPKQPRLDCSKIVDVPYGTQPGPLALKCRQEGQVE